MSNICTMITWFPIQFSLALKNGLLFELWLRDSHFNFHQKIAMIFILIYIFFMFSSSFRFSMCDCVIPVSPVTPNSNSSPEKMSNIWAVVAWFPFQFPPENCHVINLDWYILYIFFFLYIFHLWLRDPRVPQEPQLKF